MTEDKQQRAPEHKNWEVEALIAMIKEDIAQANAEYLEERARRMQAETELAKELARQFNQLWQQAVEETAPW